VIVDLENDDPKTESAQRIISFIETANDANLFALPDFGNGLMGGDEAYNARQVATMFRHAKNIAHVKDAESVDGKLRRVDLKQLFDIAKAAGFRGYFSMESDSDADPFEDTTHLVERSLALM
jgi:sugar phosphate isomerase/epimerase